MSNPRMTREELVAAAESIGMRFPDPEAEPVEGHADWEVAEEWMPLAWELCADECGEDACNELVWEGSTAPLPWGDRWMKYEDQARGMIAKVRKHVPDTRPAAPLSEDDAAGTVADRLDRMADVLPGGSQQSSDLRAAATAWRKHLRGPGTPSPSPQPTDEANDADRLDWLSANPACSITEEDGKWYVGSEDDGTLIGGPHDHLRSAIDAARLATTPDNAAGREGQS